MSRRAKWIGLAVLLLAVAVLVAGAMRLFGNRVEPAAGSSAAQAAVSTSTSAAPAPRAQAIELAPGDTARAERVELATQLAVSGGLKAVDSAIVKAKVAAELKRLSVREGDRVSAGQLLGRLDATEYQWRLRQAEDQAAAAQAQLDIAERTLANNKALVDRGFISKNALDTSASSSAGAHASLQAARAAAEIARKAVQDTEIRAPIGGLVAQRLLQPGERATVDARIVEIVDLSRIELEAAVAPDDVVKLRVGQAARVAIDGVVQPVAAKVTRIAPSAQTGTRTVLAYLLLESPEGLRQGLFARATVDLQRQQALVVPVSALRYDQAKPYVLTLEDGKAVQRVVSTGARGEVPIDGKREAAVEIVEGLSPGAVVLRGTVGALREGTLLKLVAPAGSPAAGGSKPLATVAPASAVAAR
jgi:membrane fusion protein, multidrug efflux system